jgi:hypothetical protein
MITAEPRRNVQALLRIWPELPTLLGPVWSELFPRCRDLLIRIETCTDPEDRDWLAVDLTELLSPHEAVRRRLQEIGDFLGKDPEHRGHGIPGTETPPPEWGELEAGIENCLHPPVVTCYTDVSAPCRLQRGRRGALTVGLSLALRAVTQSDGLLVKKFDGRWR